jgi:general secretion pathway protein D
MNNLPKITFLISFMALKTLAASKNWVPENPIKEATRQGMLDALDAGWKDWGSPPSPSKHGIDQQQGVGNPLEKVMIDKIEFQKTPLRHVLAYCSELAIAQGMVLNWVLMDSSYNPEISLNLQQMPLKRVLELVAAASGCELYEDNQVLFFCPNKSFAGEGMTFQSIGISRAAVGQIVGDPSLTEKKQPANTLSTAEEERCLKAFFKRAGIDFDLPNCHFAFDGNRLIVTHHMPQIQRLKFLIKNYENTPQVEIEAKFMEVSQAALEEIGTQWRLTHGKSLFQTFNPADGATSVRSLQNAFGNHGFTGGAGSIVMDQKTIATIPNVPPIAPESLNLGGMAPNLLQVKGRIGSVNIDMLLKALQQKGGGELMSAPKLTVLSGKCAEIVVAKEFRYPQSYDQVNSAVGMNGSAVTSGGSAGVTITAGTPRDFAMRRLGVEMKVLPIVEHGRDSIFLQLEPQVTELDGFVEYGGRNIAISGNTTVNIPSGFSQPTFSVRKIQTQVYLQSGETMIMGGLLRDEKKVVSDKVPFLGDLPLIGLLFRSKGETQQKKNLVIVVRAEVIQ